MQRVLWYSGAVTTLFLLAGGLTAQEPAVKTTPAIKLTPAVKATPATKTVKPTTSIFSTILGGTAARPGAEPAKSKAQIEAENKGSHTKSSTIAVRSSDGKHTLQTLTVDAEGRVLALAAPPRSFGAGSKDAVSEVHVFSPEGKKVTHWQVKFHANSINVGPDGSVYVAGDGKIARFDKMGKQLAQTALPHIEKLLANKDEMRKAAAEQLKQQQDSFQKMVDEYKKRKEDLEKIAADKRTTAQKNQLRQYDSILKSYEQTAKVYASRTVDSIIEGNLGRLRTINAVAVSDKDIFIACGEAKGYGYSVWRLGHDFKEPKQVLTGLAGCCGQMDVQCCGEDLLVAQNCDHKFGKYTREGKKIGAWGKRGTDAAVDCFGGCCNPMNVRALKNEVYTAESEGLIKRFSDKGDFLGVVGYAPLTGGCKNVAVGVSPDGNKVYFADQPGSRIIVMEKKPTASE